MYCCNDWKDMVKGWLESLPSGVFVVNDVDHKLTWGLLHRQ
jgi:hypothetical protein